MFKTRDTLRCLPLLLVSTLTLVPAPALTAGAATRPAATQPAASPSAVTTPAPTPADDELDLGPIQSWYRARAGNLHQLSPAASAEDLAFTVNLIEFIVNGDDDVWKRMEPRVRQAFHNPAFRLNIAVVNTDKEAAARYHAAGAPLTQVARAGRDAEKERRLFGKALLYSLADPDLYNHLAIAGSLSGDEATAERYAMLAIGVDPTFIAAYQELAYSYKNAARYDDVITIADRGLAVDGDINTKALLLARKGQAYWMLKKEEDALGAFRSSKRIGGPSWVDSYLAGEQALGKGWQEPQPKPAPKPEPATAPAAAAGD